MSDDLRTLLALSELPRLTRGSRKRLLAWSREHERAIPSLRDAIALLGFAEPSDAAIDEALKHADRVLEHCQRIGIAILQYGSPSYPIQLERLAHPPSLLFAKGNFDWRAAAPRVAVIGTRTPTPWGLKTAKTCAARIVSAEGVVISGLAPGIDTAAHAATVAARGTTWAVLAMGIDAISTASQQSLANQILDSGGALLSEYPPCERARRPYFVARDRIQAGLSDAVLLIESELDGGAIHTVRFAQRSGVPVWATLPRAHEGPRRRLVDVQQGPSELLRSGTAIRVTSAKVLDDLIRSLPPLPANR